MVWIRMGEDKRVDSSYLLLPKKRSDHILPDIETVLRKTPSVDQHLFPLRKFNEDGVSMADIDKSQLQILLKRIFEVPISQIAGKGDAEPYEETADPLSLSEMDRQKEKGVKEGDFKSGGG
jgi:hypothetical protein